MQTGRYFGQVKHAEQVRYVLREACEEGLFWTVLRGVSALGKGTDGVQILNFLRLDSKHMLRVTSGSPAESRMVAGFGEVRRPRHYQVVTR